MEEAKTAKQPTDRFSQAVDRLFPGDRKLPPAARRLKHIRLGLIPIYGIALAVVYFGLGASLLLLGLLVVLFALVNYGLILFYLRAVRPHRAALRAGEAAGSATPGAEELPGAESEELSPVTPEPKEPLTGYNPLTFVSYALSAGGILVLFGALSPFGFVLDIAGVIFGHVALAQVNSRRQNGRILTTGAVIFGYLAIVGSVVAIGIFIHLFIRDYHGGVPVD